MSNVQQGEGGYRVSPEIGEHLADYMQTVEDYSGALDASIEAEMELAHLRQEQAALTGELLPISVLPTRHGMEKTYRTGENSRVTKTESFSFPERKHSFITRNNEFIYFGETDASRSVKEAADTVADSAREAAATIEDIDADEVEKVAWASVLQTPNQATFNPEPYITESIRIINAIKNRTLEESHLVWSTLRTNEVSKVIAGRITGLALDTGKMKPGSRLGDSPEKPAGAFVTLEDAVGVTHESHDDIHVGGVKGMIGSGRWETHWQQKNPFSAHSINELAIPLLGLDQITGNIETSYSRARQLLGEIALTEEAEPLRMTQILNGTIAKQKGAETIGFGSDFDELFYGVDAQIGAAESRSALIAALEAGIDTQVVIEDADEAERFTADLVSAMNHNYKVAAGLDTGKKRQKPYLANVDIDKIRTGLRMYAVDRSQLVDAVNNIVADTVSNTLADTVNNAATSAAREQILLQVDALYETRDS